MIKIPPKILSLPLFIIVDWLVINNVRDLFYVETVHFLYFVQFDLLKLQGFCFQHSSCHSFNTSSLLCEYRIKHCVQFITCQKFLSFFPRGFIYRRCQNNIWSLVISDYFRKTTNQLWTENSKTTGLNDFKSCQKNGSLSLAKGKPDEKNEWRFSNQTDEVMCASIKELS